MKVQVVLLALSLTFAGFASRLPQGAAPPSTISFNRDVKPILSEHCFKCHGPDAAFVAAGLRLDSFEEATKDRGGRRGITPGNPSKSWVWLRVSHQIEDLRMPPPDSGVKPLSREQLDILKRWIAAGAKYEQHWAFVPPKRPVIPHVSDYSWVKTNIDRFVLNALDKAKLRPEAEADKPTLIRRVALTLTGLPPSPEEIDAFAKDAGAGAYERMVDRYLASPRYGEHQARYWLDAVRYGDTHGLHLDNERAIHPYRDWVVRNLNADLPFDLFTVWQIAGDLLPNPTAEQLIATGYVRMNPTTAEGGAIEEEFLAKNTFDRVDTTSTVFLGLTVACARCHDHKYDPISHKDYYRLYAFFNSTADAPLDGNQLVPGPAIRAIEPHQQAVADTYEQALEKSIRAVDAGKASQWLEATWAPPLETETWEVSGPYAEGSFDAAFAGKYPPEEGGGEWRPLDLKLNREAASVVGKENAAAYVRGTLVSLRDTRMPLRLSSDDGLKVWINGALVHENKVLRGVAGGVDEFLAPLKVGRNTILIKLVNGAAGDGLVVRVGNAFTEQLDKLYHANPRNPLDLASAFLEAGPATPESLEFRKTKRERDAFIAEVPMSLVAKELDKPRPSFVLRRGEYDLKGEKVDRGVPQVLGSLPPGVPPNRLGLAKWLTDPSHPLTARVFVNRVWQQHFGTGIVKTAEDFGNQGEWPSHPALLDYLATSFRDNGWSLKRLHRQIVNSAAFRQRSVVTKEKLERDPENRLISRGPRFRLDAEVIRDKALMVSGLLVERQGGKGFKPYQPDGIWEAIAFLDSNTARYTKDTGEDIYRRSLYLFWKRTSPHPVMLTFDAPMREACTVRRSRTNTPMQALVTLNEPAFLEASRVMAERVCRTDGSFEDRLNLAYRLAFSRPAKPDELRIMNQAYGRYLERFRRSPDDAKKLLAVGDAPRTSELPFEEHAAWMLICSTLINTDEFLTQH